MDSIAVQDASAQQWMLPDLTSEPVDDSPILRARLALRRTNQDTDFRGLRSRFDARTLLAYCVVFLFIYSPAILLSYGMTDSYADLYAGTHGTLVADNLVVVGEGRWISAFLINATYSSLHDISELRYLRLLSILGIALFAWVMRGILLNVGIPRTWAAVIPALICVTPTFQVYAAWDVCWPYPYAAGVAGIAAVIGKHGLDAWLDRKQLMTGLRNCLAAIGLLLLSMATYQPAAMVFWAFAAVLLLCDHSLRFRRSVLFLVVLGMIMIVAVGLDAESGRLLPPLIAGHPYQLARTQLVTDVPGKAWWFFYQPLLDALNVYNLIPTFGIALVVLELSVMGLFVYIQGRFWTRFGKVGIALLLLPLSYMPNLVVAENWAAYRTQPGITALCVLYASLAALGVLQRGNALIRTGVANVALAGVVVAVSFVATRNVLRDFALPQSEELAVLQTQLEAGNLSAARSIYMIPASADDSAAAEVRYDEYGVPSSSKPWSQMQMTYFVLEEIDPARANIPVRVGPADGSGTPPPGSEVIDLRLLRDARPYPPRFG